MLFRSVLIFARFKTSVTNPAAFAKEDINHDGYVDILDAFAVARQLKGESRPDTHLDVNGDGVVDERDVQVIATRAVELPKGGPS